CCRGDHHARQSLQSANDQPVIKFTKFSIVSAEIYRGKIAGTQPLTAQKCLLQVRTQRRSDASTTVSTSHRTFEIKKGCLRIQRVSAHCACTDIRKRAGQTKNPYFKIAKNNFRSGRRRSQRVQTG